MLKKIMTATAILLIIASSAQAEKVLRLTLQLPATHHLGKNVQAFADEVADKTGGEVKLEIYPSAQLYKDSEVPQAVASGAVEMGVASVSQFAGTIPAVDLFYVPFLFSSQDALNKAVAKGSPVRQPLDDAILLPVLVSCGGRHTVDRSIPSKGAPVIVPDDLKGKKVRVFSKTLEN